MRTSHTIHHARTRRRFAAGMAAGALVLAACGGGSDDASGDGEALPPTEADAGAVDTDAVADPAAPVAVGAGQVDLVGTDVRAESEFAENLLPSVLVDDLNNGRKVNFRNLVPQEKPILLWMYAPH